MTDLSKESWYHGRVSRVDAEKILDNAGGGEGTYLVRDSLTITGEYVLSLCHQVHKYCFIYSILNSYLMYPQSKKFHYIISRQQDGSVAIQDGVKFPSPIELVQYHTHKVDGLLTTLQLPCPRRAGQPPQGYRFISHEEMQEAMREAALLLGYQVQCVFVCVGFYCPVLVWKSKRSFSVNRKCLLLIIDS